MTLGLWRPWTIRHLDRATWRDADAVQLASDSLDNIHTKLRSTKGKGILVQCVSAHTL
jgi:hypothetical protein